MWITGASSGGAIVHVGPAAGLRGEELRTVYSATKAGLLGLSGSIAMQYGKRGIRSNCRGSRLLAHGSDGGGGPSRCSP